MLRKLFFLLIIFFSIFILASPAVATTPYSTNNTGWIVIHVPAVTDSGGKIIDVLINLTQNNPGIHFPEGIDIGEDTRASAWISFFVASIFSNNDPRMIGVGISFLNNTYAIEGPSASLAISLGIYSLLKNNPPINISKTAITGAINLNGLSVIVGGIHAKYNATVNNNLEELFLPLSNYYFLENSSLRVKGVKGLIDTYNLLIGRSYAGDGISLQYPKELKEYLRNTYIILYNNTMRLIEDIGPKEEIEQLLKNAKTESMQEHYYTAASLAYNAYIQAIYASLQNKGENGLSNTTIYNKTLASLKELEKSLEKYENTIKNKNEVGQYTLELLGLTESRVWMCKTLLKEYNSTLLTIDEKRYTLAEAIARCETAKIWINSLDIEWKNQPLVKIELMDGVLDYYFSILEKALRYIDSLTKDVELPPSLQLYLQELHDLYEKIMEAEEKGSIGLRYGLASELASRVTSLLTQINLVSNDIALDYRNELLRNFIILNGIALEKSHPSIISALYLEYSNYFVDKDPVSSLLLLDNAISPLYPLILYGFTEEENSLYETHGLLSGFQGTREAYFVWLFFGIVVTLGLFLNEVIKKGYPS